MSSTEIIEVLSDGGGVAAAAKKNGSGAKRTKKKNAATESDKQPASSVRGGGGDDEEDPGGDLDKKMPAKPAASSLAGGGGKAGVSRKKKGGSAAAAASAAAGTRKKKAATAAAAAALKIRFLGSETVGCCDEDEDGNDDGYYDDGGFYDDGFYEDDDDDDDGYYDDDDYFYDASLSLFDHLDGLGAPPSHLGAASAGGGQAAAAPLPSSSLAKAIQHVISSESNSASLSSSGGAAASGTAAAASLKKGRAAAPASSSASGKRRREGKKRSQPAASSSAKRGESDDDDDVIVIEKSGGGGDGGGVEVIDLEKEEAADADGAAGGDSDMAAALQYRKDLGPMRFEFCEELRHHSFGREGAAAGTAGGGGPGGNAKHRNKLARELLEYKLNLPVESSSSVFVRAQESKINLTRALITGPEDTPYANGCFMFDFLLHDYPNAPPKAKFLTTASGRVRFNPNLYACGKVCLSLLGTWSGPGWQPNKSTLLQVLVSIQGLILVPDPYYNEPGYAPGKMKAESDRYTKNIRRYTVEHAISGAIRAVLAASPSSSTPTLSPAKRPPAKPGIGTDPYYPEFEDVVFEHFKHRAAAIEAQLRAWQAEDATIASRASEARGLLGVVAQAGDLPAARAAYVKFARKTPKPRHPADPAGARSLFFPPPDFFPGSLQLPSAEAAMAAMTGPPPSLAEAMKNAPLPPSLGSWSSLSMLPQSSTGPISAATGAASSAAAPGTGARKRGHRFLGFSPSGGTAEFETLSAAKASFEAVKAALASSAAASSAASSATAAATATERGADPHGGVLSLRSSRYLRRSVASPPSAARSSPGRLSDRLKRRRSSHSFEAPAATSTAASAAASANGAGANPARSLKKPPPGSLLKSAPPLPSAPKEAPNASSAKAKAKDAPEIIVID